MSKPRVFVASSSESKDVAFALQENLEEYTDVTVWSQGFFDLTDVIITKLVQSLRNFEFAVFVFSPDDVLLMRGEKHNVVRDNVVFELGLFIGGLGSERTFIIAPHGNELRLPSDLAGIVAGRYKTDRDDDNLTAALGPVSQKIRKQIMRKNKKNVDFNAAISFITDYKDTLQNNKIIDSIVLEHANELIGFIKALPRGNITVKTQILYEKILECMKSYSEFMIIDHDINRWNELINSEDKIGYNTFNYSKDILEYTVGRAITDEAYSLKRVFVLNENDLSDENINRVRKILEIIASHTSTYKDKIETKIYLIKRETIRTDRILLDKVENLKDVVIVTKPGSMTMFREGLTYNNRKKANATDSEVINSESYISKAAATFRDLNSKSVNVEDFLNNLTSEEYQ